MYERTTEEVSLEWSHHACRILSQTQKLELHHMSP